MNDSKIPNRVPSGSKDLRIALGFALYLHAAWLMAWLFEQLLEKQFEVLPTSGSRSAYWFVAKILLWVLPSLFVIRRSSQPLREVMGFDRVRAILVWGGGIGLALGSTAFITKTVNHQPFIPSEIGWPFFNAVFVAPIVEELAFRGVILGFLVNRYRFLAANVLSSVLFLTIHMVGWYFQGRLMANLLMPVGGALSIFFIGLILGFVAHKSRSVAASTLTHLLNNLASA